MKSLHSSLHFSIIFYQFSHTQFGKTATFAKSYEVLPNCIRLSSYLHFPTAFSDKIIYLSAKIHNILFLFTYNSGNPWLLPESILLPNCINRHVNSGIKKAKKERLTNRHGEPLYAQKPLISSHFYALSPNRSKFLWHYFWIAACAAVRLWWLLPLFTPFTPPNSTFDKRDSTNCSFTVSVK